MKLFEPRGRRTLEPRDQHFPTPVPIDAYGDGGFRFADMSHRGSIMVLPSGVHGWSAVTPKDVTLETLALAIDQAGEYDVLLVGTGVDLVPLPGAVAAALRERGARFEVMSTGAAIRIFNIMIGENRKFAAAFLAVE
ncbi:Mth938-like domain-containing protein [Oryzibacter oryziterrae]|uniref:Mth938-like domain-containing protein n=1 Tax=Oryzibacter oryziterrae TaxID=2766474 RepID=UPI001F3DC804|nr:MTH938/NDUFAF3 family protein [Oryzibacter oryziterrae]